MDAEELRREALGAGSDDDFDGLDGVGGDAEMEGTGEEGEEIVLPTAEEREEERRTGAQDLGLVQRRMRHCARVLSSFKKLAAKDRYSGFSE